MIEDLTVCDVCNLVNQKFSRFFLLQQSFEDAELKKKDVEEEEGKPDPLSQLVTTFNRGATTERVGSSFDDDLYMAYAIIMAKYSTLSVP